MNEGLKHLLIEQEKRNSLTPERLFLDMLTGLTPMTNDRYPESVFYWKNEHIWFEEDMENDRLWCSHRYVWSIFEKKYGYNYNEIQSIMEDMLENMNNWKGLTPEDETDWSELRLENMDNWKGLTPSRLDSLGNDDKLENMDNWKELI